MKFIRKSGEIFWGKRERPGVIETIVREDAPAYLDEEGSSCWYIEGSRTSTLPNRLDRESSPLLQGRGSSVWIRDVLALPPRMSDEMLRIIDRRR